MKNLLISIVLLVAMFPSVSSEIVNEWNSKLKQCESALIDGDLSTARYLAFELNGIDPADTHVMYYIVLTSVELGVQVPVWLLAEPWPNSSEIDRRNYQRAMELIKDVHKK